MIPSDKCSTPNVSHRYYNIIDDIPYAVTYISVTIESLHLFHSAPQPPAHLTTISLFSVPIILDEVTDAYKNSLLSGRAGIRTQIFRPQRPMLWMTSTHSPFCLQKQLNWVYKYSRHGHCFGGLLLYFNCWAIEIIEVIFSNYVGKYILKRLQITINTF